LPLFLNFFDFRADSFDKAGFDSDITHDPTALVLKSQLKAPIARPFGS